MKLWQILFDDHQPWQFSILVAAEYPAYCEQDALDAAADSKEGQRYVMDTNDMAEFKTEEEADGYCTYLGNASQPFARENIGMREVTPEQVLESGAKLRPINMDADTFAREFLDVHHKDDHAVSTCEICTAMECELYLWATHLLALPADKGTPIMTVYEWLMEGKTVLDLENERVELMEEDHVKCPSCYVVTWGTCTVCENCHGSIPEISEEE